MKLYFDDPGYDDQLKRTAAAAYSASADLGEMLVAASAVKPNPVSWYMEWSALAERTEALARAAATDRVSVAGAWLRAAEYWRQAFFFVRGDASERRLQTGWSRHRDAFRKALALLPTVSTIAEIPFGTGTMTGYLMRPAGDTVARPTLIIPAGYDSTAESGYSETAWLALERGMNAFTLEGARTGRHALPRQDPDAAGLRGRARAGPRLAARSGWCGPA